MVRELTGGLVVRGLTGGLVVRGLTGGLCLEHGMIMINR